MILETDIDEKKWRCFIQYFINVSDEVSFNILYKGREYDSFIKKYEEDLVFRNYQNDAKIYPSGESICFRLSDKIKKLLTSLNYEEWKNRFITDLSFYNQGYEIVASVVHENYLIFNNNFKDHNYFTQNGFLMNKQIDDFSYEGFSILRWIKKLLL